MFRVLGMLFTFSLFKQSYQYFIARQILCLFYCLIGSNENVQQEIIDVITAFRFT